VDLYKAIVEAVENYLRTCERLSRVPCRPYSGQFKLRLDPALHAKAAIEGERKGKSLNAWVTKVIQNQVSI
jgi:predicted HicB family RNase H-like nuclease